MTEFEIAKMMKEIIDVCNNERLEIEIFDDCTFPYIAIFDQEHCLMRYPSVKDMYDNLQKRIDEHFKETGNSYAFNYLREL